MRSADNNSMSTKVDCEIFTIKILSSVAITMKIKHVKSDTH